MRYLDGATWSYNEHAPTDADTIAHALILADAIGERRPDAALALARYQTADGGFATFAPGTPGAEFASWTRSHPDVTPVAVRALAAYRDLSGLDDAIARAVARGPADRLDGARAFWWDLDWYTTAMWIDAYGALALAFDAVPPPVAPAPRTLLDATYLLAIACAVTHGPEAPIPSAKSRNDPLSACAASSAAIARRIVATATIGPTIHDSIAVVSDRDLVPMTWRTPAGEAIALPFAKPDEIIAAAVAAAEAGFDVRADDDATRRATALARCLRETPDARPAAAARSVDGSVCTP